MDWYERMREHNDWLPPADKVLDAEVRYAPPGTRWPTMDLTVRVVMPPAPRPTWEGSLPTVPRPALDALPNALAHLAQAMAGGGRGHRSHLVQAGAQVRAMAPADEAWSAAYAPERGTRLGLLREAAADVVQAADWQDRDNPERAAMWLRAADAILHGLWLEEGRRA